MTRVGGNPTIGMGVGSCCKHPARVATPIPFRDDGVFILETERRVLDVITPAELVEMMLDKQIELENSLEEYRKLHEIEANAERDYRKMKGRKWEETLTLFPDTKTHTAGYREAWVSSWCSDLRYERDVATANAKAAAEHVRNLRQSLSSLQTAQKMMQEELGNAFKGPNLEP